MHVRGLMKSRRLWLCVMVLSLLMTSVGQSAEDGHGDPNNLAHNDATAEIDAPLELNVDLATFTLAVFLGLVGVLGAFAWKPIMHGLAEREKSMDGKLAEAQRMFDEAETKLNEYNRRLNESQQEVRQLREQAMLAADEKGKQMIAEAQASAKAERDRSLREIEAAKVAAINELSSTSVNLAIDLASKITRKELRPDDHAALIRDAIEQIPSKN
ncbi:MAG: ATP synthase F0 subunit B [Pirellulaceae bacterium]